MESFHNMLNDAFVDEDVRSDIKRRINEVIEILSFRERAFHFVDIDNKMSPKEVLN